MLLGKLACQTGTKKLRIIALTVARVVVAVATAVTAVAAAVMIFAAVAVTIHSSWCFFLPLLFF